jgi:pimeloyl-ACP methyl ester carboxylesterase
LPYTEVNGEQYFYSGDLHKEGRPVLFIHGSGGNHRHWLFQLKELCGGVINPLALDLPGHGRSAGEASDSIAAYRDWVREFTVTLGLTGFVLAGHSLGGAIAMDYALHYPGDLAGLVLVGTGGRLRVAPAILQSFRAGTAPDGMTDYAYGPQAPPELLDRARIETESVAAEVFLADFTACDRFDIMEQISQITLPTLIICGTADRLTPIKYSRYMNQLLPQSEMVEVEDAGHMVMLEAPGELNRSVTLFMEKLSLG